MDWLAVGLAVTVHILLVCVGVLYCKLRERDERIARYREKAGED